MSLSAQIDFAQYYQLIEESSLFIVAGRVTRVVGLTIEVCGITASIGEICQLVIPNQPEIDAEVVGFRGNRTLLMPLGELEGIAPGCLVIPTGKTLTVEVGPELLGRVVDGLGIPLDERDLGTTGGCYPVNNSPPKPLARCRINNVFATGVKTIDALLTCGRGQRLGIFSGSGVGKSTLLGMIARYSTADVNVICLVGERGREVLDFLEKDLGAEGLAKSVVVVATSDQPALQRIKCALVATAIAEYFRDSGKHVCLMMDSITRVAMAQREVGLAIGEPPTSRGYTPSVFALLPKLLERAGNTNRGSITGYYTVLVDADDLNEPITDAVRGILDGHIVLSRDLAHRNHFPAIDVLSSISRLMSDIATGEHRILAGRLREMLANYREAEDLINIGAYQKGTNPQIDRAIKYYEPIIAFLRQEVGEHLSFENTISNLVKVFEN